LCFFDVFDILLISICMPLDLLFFSKGALKNHNLVDFCTHFLGVFIKHQGKNGHQLHRGSHCWMTLRLQVAEVRPDHMGEVEWRIHQRPMG